MLHLKLDVNTSIFHDMCQKFNSINHPALTFVMESEAIKHLIHKQQLVCSELQDFDAAIRQKRGIFSTVLASIAGFFGLNALADIISGRTQQLGHVVHTIDDMQWKIQNIYKTLDKVDFTLRQLDEQAKNNTLWLQQLTHVTMLQSITDDFQTNVQFLIDTIPLLYMSRVPPTLIHSKDVRNLYNFIKSKINNEIFLPTNIINQFYLLPVSTIHENSILSIIIHIPTSNLPPLNLYHFKQQAIPIQQNDSVIFADIKLSKEFIAINSDKSKFLDISEKELQACIKIQNSYFCQNAHLNYKNSNFCIYNLFTQNYANIHFNCPTSVSKQTFSIHPLPQGWLIATSKPIDVHIQCDHGKINKTVIQNIKILNISNDCKIFSNLFIINGKTLNINLENKQFIFNETQMSHWHITNYIPEIFNKSTLTIWETSKSCEPNFLYPMLTNTLPLSILYIIVFIIIFSICFCMYKNERSPHVSDLKP